MILNYNHQINNLTEKRNMSIEKTKLFSTARTDVYSLTEDFSEQLQLFLVENRDNFAPFEPLRTEDYFSLDSIRQRIVDSQPDFKAKKCLLLVFTSKGENKIIGSINFTNFVYGVFQAGYLGFSIDKSFQGQGLMRETLESAIAYVHENYGLHRIMANHLPENIRSQKILASLGFVREGFAKSYLKINGTWQDHVLNSYITPEK
ncbi:GNAT family N-acetyltransferase [Dickeya dianthicola]|nr:GNAT family N-acetyltransferase [Dickeya dianthicola]ATO31978.1 Ribosomal-protein-S5p-alanin acetyltransferase [Dickeya dianthicola RNS04.9]MCA7005171.1 GNAT family N-acetyltransferase [Dickeya dianthicola]MCI4029494.1 GNAT family N-acetyltransferase [Dickeya dianthicola]MCI4117134.1 GNAT family N-acetyltransferase [Dickeya dianthicola]MCI4192196.1 GNAT family N-acetyltransferase [Dickeya dianthicola]